MWYNLGRYVKKERLKKGLNSSELAHFMGYKNINRGMRRILSLEGEGEVHPEVLKKLIEALNLSQEKVDEQIKKDKEQRDKEFQEWVNTPIKKHLIIRWMAAMYGMLDIPEGIQSEEEVIKYACDKAKELKCMLWLVLSRKENIQINKEGEVLSRNEFTIDRSFLPFTAIR